MNLAALLSGELGHVALIAGLVGIAFVAWAAPRKVSPGPIALWLGFTCLAGAGVLGSTEQSVIDARWSEQLVWVALVGIAAGGALMMVEYRIRERALRKSSAEAESHRREVERVTGLNVKLEDELQESRRRPREGTSAGASGALGLEATVVRQRKALEAANAAARKLRGVIDGAVEGIAMLQRETLKLSEFNPALAKMTGVDPKELGQKTLLDLFSDSAAKPGKSDLQRAARERGALAATFRRADGQELPVEVTICAVGEGEDACLVAVIRDVSVLRTAADDGEKALLLARERVRVAEDSVQSWETKVHDLEDERARLMQLNERKDEYISSVSHELKTPLTNILSFSEILFEKAQADAGRGVPESNVRMEFLGIIHKECERLTRMVTSVLDLARIEAGAVKLNVAEFDARDVVADVIASMLPAARERKVKIEALPDGKARPMRADRDRVQQLVMNLLSNALRYSNAEQTVHVRFEDAEPAGRVRIAVEDHGPGISQEDAGRIFDKFQRVEDGSEASRVGTGLGLAICREIATLHGGRIWVDSQIGKGSVFRAEFPGPEEARTRPSFNDQPQAETQVPPLKRAPVSRFGGPAVRQRVAAEAGGKLPPLGR